MKDDLKRQKLSFTKQNTELSKLTDKFEERLARQERRDGDQDEIMRKLEQAIEINEKNVMKSKQNAAANSNIRKQIELEALRASHQEMPADQTDSMVDAEAVNELEEEIKQIKKEIQKLKDQMWASRPQSNASRAQSKQGDKAT